MNGVASGRDDRATVRARQFLRSEQLVTVLGLGSAGYVYLTSVESRLGLAVLALLVGTILTLEVCLRRLRPDRLLVVSMVALVNLWATSVALAPMVPFLLPLMPFPVVIALLTTAYMVDRRQLVVLISAGVAVMTAIALLAITTAPGTLGRQVPQQTIDAVIVTGLGLRVALLSLAVWDAHVRHEAALAAAGAANAALAESRARLVEASDAERRRLERDLHDGAQQRLVATALRLRLLSAQNDPLRPEIEPIVEELNGALDDLRNLAHGIYPPLLERRGLVDALRAACRRAGVPARVEAATVGRYPPALEAAVYFCCLEAMQNAAKHAGAAATLTISLNEQAGGLELEIADDGEGFDTSTSEGGRGLRNMADRLGSVGADLVVDSRPGEGTVLRARVPLDEIGVSAPPSPHGPAPST